MAIVETKVGVVTNRLVVMLTFFIKTRGVDCFILKALAYWLIVDGAWA
jgi:hypothetical protein